MDNPEARHVRFDELPLHGLAWLPVDPLQQLGGVDIERNGQLDQRVDARNASATLKQANGGPVEISAIS